MTRSVSLTVLILAITSLPTGATVPIELQPPLEEPSFAAPTAHDESGKLVPTFRPLRMRPIDRAARVQPAEGKYGSSGEPDKEPTPDRAGIDDDGPAQAGAKGTVRVYGRIVVRDGDAALRAVDGATVKVYDEDWGPDDFLAMDATDPDGYFDISFNWDPGLFGDTRPDLYVRASSVNTEVNVESDKLELTYDYSSPTWDDYTGSTLNVGELQPERNGGALFVLTSMTRAWRWIKDTDGKDLRQVDVQWPDDDDGPSRYNSTHEEIHLQSSATYNETVHIHEYGHYFIDLYATYLSPDYCANEAGTENCTHGQWCTENETIAWGEGWPTWLAYAVMDDWESRYGETPSSDPGIEYREKCANIDYPDAERTEGAVSALLRDIQDSTNENDPAFPLWSDELSLGPEVIMQLTDEINPTTVGQFFNEMVARYPQYRPALWATAHNSGFSGLDTAPPANPTPTSFGHPVNVPSADDTVRFEWSPGVDDLSGMYGYSVVVSEGGPAPPDMIADVYPDVPIYDTGHLAPGSYWFSLRAVDRAGNWNGNAKTYGPVVIREKDPADLKPVAGLNWDYPIVPRNSSGYTEPILAPTSMLTPTTYWYAGVINEGEASSPGFRSHLRVDGDWAGQADSGGLGGFGGEQHFLGRGPVSMVGGRHTFELWVDSGHVVAEVDEANNSWGKQWIWRPPILFPIPYEVTSLPPRRDGGWDSLSGVKWYNCNGYKLPVAPFLSQTTFVAASLVPSSNLDDYDLRLHDEATSATSGFASNLGYSGRPAGHVDAVLVNWNARPRDYYNVGVLNPQFTSNDGYVVEAHFASPIATGSTQVTEFGDQQVLHLYTLDIDAGDDPLQSIYLRVDTTVVDDAVHIAWFSPGFDTGTLLDYDAEQTTDQNGIARLDLNLSVGRHGFAVWRDARDGGLNQRAYEIEVVDRPAELQLAAPTWDAPVLPTPSAGGGSIVEPTSLTGDAPATYVHSSTFNASAAAAGSFDVRLYLDGVLTTIDPVSSLGGGGYDTFHATSPWTVRGGRHVISATVDGLDAVRELDEANNAFGVQYVWNPAPLPMGGSQIRSRPPDRTAHWDRVPAPFELWFNCDGVRTPTFAPSGNQGHWGVVSTMAGEFSDVDLRLHEVSTGASDGFDDPLVESSWPTGQSDFVLVNFRQTNVRRFDAGILRGTFTKEEDYVISSDDSQYLGQDPDSPFFGPYNLAADALVAVHEIHITTPANYLFALNGIDGDVDLGFSLYGPGVEFAGKEDATVDWQGNASIAWTEPAGVLESFQATLTEPGYYALVVWKVDWSGVGQSEKYELSITRDAQTDASPQPRATQLTSTYPNPFNPQTTIAFELARAGMASLEVYDMRGRLVRRLVSQALDPGRHQRVWDGKDERGHRVASGSYVVRLSAGDTTASQLVALVK